MTTNNLDSLRSSPFGTLAPEMTQHILKHVNPSDLLATQRVCKELKDQSDGLITHQWNKTKKLPSNEIIPLQKMMISIEKENPVASCLTLFKKLTKCFRDTYGVDISSTTVSCSATQIAELQRRGKEIADQSLVTLWKEIQEQLHLPAPPQTAAEIRIWMNDPTNVPRLNQITELNVAYRKLRTIPPEIRFLTQLQKLWLDKRKKGNR